MRKTREKFAIGIILFFYALFSFTIVSTKTFAATQIYSIIYNANGGTGAPVTQIKAKDKTITLSSKIPKRDGHKFLGWTTTSTSKTVKYKPGSKYSANNNLKLFAVWEANTYKISYNTNGGSSAPAAQTKTYGKDLKLTTFTPTKKGYIFQGWAKSNGATVPQYKGGSIFKENKNTTLYAVWKIKTFTIKYDANKGTNAPAAQIKKYGQTITLSKNKPKRANHTFIGWAKSKTSQLPDYKAGGKYSANTSVILYAYWIQDTFKITFHANGGSGGISSQIKKRGEDLKLSKSMPTRSGYTFLGWGLSKDATTVSYYPGDVYKQNKEIDLYAIWGKTMRTTSEKRYYVFATSKEDGDFGIVDAKLVYREEYKKKGTKVHFYNHSTYLGIDGALVNDCYELSIYPPKFVTHKNGRTEKEKKFIVNQAEDVLGGADYVFSYVNREKVTYDVDDTVKGSCGYFILFGGIPHGDDSVEMQLCSGNSVRANYLRAKGTNDKGYFYSLGKLANECGKVEIEQDNAVYKPLKKSKKESLEIKDYKDVIATFDDEIIYDIDVKASIEEKKLSNNITREDIENIIYREIIRRKLDKQVEKNCFEKNIEDAEDYICRIRKELPMVENYDAYLAFIDGLGVEEDVYWEAQKEPYRKKLGRSEYLDQIYMEYCSGEELSISDEYRELQEILKIKSDGKKIEKYDMIKIFKEIILNTSDIIMNENVIKLYL